MKPLKSSFKSREALVDYVRDLALWCDEKTQSEIEGNNAAMQQKIGAMDPINYAKTRNHIDGKVTRLSPYIRHGLVNLNTVRNEALSKASQPEQIEKFIQELAWRDFWQRIYERHPEWIWQNVEEYKTGLTHDDYADDLPDDIANGETDIACLNHFIKELLETGYMHNHARMYVSSYVVHFRRIRWQAGAKWFLHHLLDGDPASNNLSWQWVASTFSNKPYIFNLENVQKYTGDTIDTSPENNKPINASYEELSARLFQ